MGIWGRDRQRGEEWGKDWCEQRHCRTKGVTWLRSREHVARQGRTGKPRHIGPWALMTVFHRDRQRYSIDLERPLKQAFVKDEET